TLEPLAADRERDLTERVGTAYQWRTAIWSDDEWAAYFAGPRNAWVIKQDEPVGIARYVTEADETEITTFGLLPEWIGRGIGGHALTLTLRKAWELNPAARRVWLHTSTLDHPNALPNYRKRGLRPYKTLER
ncbi:GNAT family N-acetyltransferase, partial [Actinomadura rubrisoli]